MQSPPSVALLWFRRVLALGILANLALAVPTLLGVATLVFAFLHLIPGDPVEIMISKLGQKGPVTPEIRASIEALLGADSSQSIWSQYGDYLAGLATGDLGVSVVFFPASVSEIIGQTLPWTIGLIGLAISALQLYGGVLVLGLKQNGRMIGIGVAALGTIFQLLSIGRSPGTSIVGLLIDAFIIWALVTNESAFTS